MKTAQEINDLISLRVKLDEIDSNDISDGYHTFGELYEHRFALYIALCKFLAGGEWVGMGNSETGFGNRVFRAKKHSDGTMYEGWFLLGVFHEKGKQISYHLPLSKWEETNFAETLEKAPEFDGHTSEDVLKRLRTL